MSSGSPVGWYVITVRKNPQSPFTVQVSRKPFPAGALVDSGPYKTQAEADAAAAKLRSAPVPGTPVPGIPNPFSWIGAVSHWVGDFVLSVTDVHMWISVGWILLGAMLVIWGLLLWLKVPQTILAEAPRAAAAAA